MTNYEAILKMDTKELEEFLDQVYLTGVNTALYAARHPEDEAVLDTNPLDQAWLSAPAEAATKAIFAEDGDTCCLDMLTASIFRAAEIDLPASEKADLDSIASKSAELHPATSENAN